jgi:hypothetical protein
VKNGALQVRISTEVHGVVSQTGNIVKAELSVESAIKDFLSSIKRLKELDVFRSGQYLGEYLMRRRYDLTPRVLF